MVSRTILESQLWLEQHGKARFFLPEVDRARRWERERERGHSLPWAIALPFFLSLPTNPPRGTGVTRGYNPLWWREAEGEGGKRGREECRVGESEWTAWPTHFSC